jgi:predicted nucleic acid-binding protein
MHQSLKDLPSRLVLDANVLLDATFVSDGVARRAVGLLSTLGFSPVVDEATEQEALGILSKLRRRVGLSFNPEALLTNYIGAMRILRVPPANPMLGGGVNRSDRHIAAAARQYNAWVLTGDAPLIVECERAGISARFPWDVLMEAAASRSGLPDLDQIIRVVMPTRETGLIFGRVFPGSWRGLRSVGRFTVCDVENVGRVYYDTHTEQWVFEMAFGASVGAKISLADEGPWAVCGSYQLGGTGGHGRITIRAGRFPSTIVGATQGTLKRLMSATPGRISFGSTVEGGEHLNGHLRAVVVGPQVMGKDTWKAIIAIKEGAPNPYDSDALERVLNTMQTLQVSQLSEADLRQ